MKKLICILLIVMPNYNIAQEKWESYRKFIKIPTHLVEKLAAFNYEDSSDSLLLELNNYLPTKDTLYTSIIKDSNLTVLMVNIDDDLSPEIILTCSEKDNSDNVYLCIFDLQENNWYLIYKENIWIFNQGFPILQVANTTSRNKLFFIQHLEDYGTGMFLSKYHFYKMIDKQIYKVVNITKEDLLNDLRLETSIHLQNIDFGKSTLELSYSYSIDIYDKTMIEGKLSVSYDWDIINLRFYPARVYFYNPQKSSLKLYNENENTWNIQKYQVLERFHDNYDLRGLVIFFGDEIKEWATNQNDAEINKELQRIWEKVGKKF